MKYLFIPLIPLIKKIGKIIYSIIFSVLWIIPFLLWVVIILLCNILSYIWTLETKYLSLKEFKKTFNYNINHNDGDTISIYHRSYTEAKYYTVFHYIWGKSHEKWSRY